MGITAKLQAVQGGAAASVHCLLVALSQPDLTTFATVHCQGEQHNGRPGQQILKLSGKGTYNFTNSAA